MDSGLKRRAFSTWGGPVEGRGDFAHLRRAMQAGEIHDLTHDFHAYPARMPPGVARALLRDAAGATVLDPFCGSGTVLVEAAARGCRAIGRDVNPLAVRLSRLKAGGWIPGLPKALAAAARRATSLLRSRRQSEPPTRGDFEPNVAWELAAIRDAIEPGSPLELVLSSMLVKFSRRESMTSGRAVRKGIPTGRAIRFFVERGRELIDMLATMKDAAPVDVKLGDARKLDLADASIDVILTSPPYAGTYRYGEATALSLAWLGEPAPVGEIGFGAYARDMRRVFAELRRVARPGARLFMVLGEALDAPGWTFVGSASQPRPVTKSREFLIEWRRS